MAQGLPPSEEQLDVELNAYNSATHDAKPKVDVEMAGSPSPSSSLRKLFIFDRFGSVGSVINESIYEKV